MEGPSSGAHARAGVFQANSVWRHGQADAASLPPSLPPPPPFPRTPSLLMGVGADTVAVIKEMEAALKNVAADDKVRWQ